jgi:Cation transporting ATPase, C-terminus
VWMDAPADHVRTVGFVALIAADLALVFATRGRQHRRPPAERNPAVRWMVLGVFAVLALILVLPWLRNLFAFAAVAPALIVLAAAAGALPVLIAWRAAGTGSPVPPMQRRPA